MIPIARLARRIARLPATALPACAALCLALFACAQPPPPQATPPAPATPTHAPLPSPPPEPTPAQPTRLPAAPAPPSVAIPTPAPTAPLSPTPTPSRQPTLPPADVAFTQISVGKTHACGLRENGAALCWGRDHHGHGSREVPAETAFRQISAGLHFTCGLRQDGTIACWGLNSDGQASPPKGAFSEIAASGGYACAIPISSQVAPPALTCWGTQFPNGAETLTPDAPISDIQAGGGSICWLTPQADVACLSIDSRLTEIISGPFTSLGVGLHHICALREDGSAFCQGDNEHFQAAPPPTKFVQIAAGWRHSCGITRASLIECWGSGRAAAPGERLTAPDGEFVTIISAWRDSCALRPNRRAVCWTTPDYLPSIVAPEIANLSDSVSIAFGGAEFNAPVDILPWPSGGLAIVDREGIIAAHHDEPNAPPRQTILDLTTEVVCCLGQNGILSAALDPQFNEFPFLYVWYSAIADDATNERMPGYVGRLSRFRVNRAAALKNSELVIIEAHMPTQSHMGGAIRFGADGMLYLGIGDDGTPPNSQSLDKLSGKIIRIDARGATAERPYRIPPDNPFMNTPGARPEIWAYGLRNPWRMAFDPANPASLFVADVGESSHEEVSIAVAGANLGWPLCEAYTCQESLDTAAANLTPPIVAYNRDVGCAVIGGVTVPWLDNRFVFSDLCSRRVWLLERDNHPDNASADTQETTQDSPQVWRMREIADLSESARNIIAFGVGADGSVYALPRTGAILRLYPDPAE